MWKYLLLGLLGLVLLLLFAPAELEAVWRREALSLRQSFELEAMFLSALTLARALP